MHSSEEEITKNFELLRLSSPEERKNFEKLGTFRLGAEPSVSFVFIRNDSTSNILELEKEDAKLERDSG